MKITTKFPRTEIFNSHHKNYVVSNIANNNKRFAYFGRAIMPKQRQQPLLSISLRPSNTTNKLYSLKPPVRIQLYHQAVSQLLSIPFHQ